LRLSGFALPMQYMDKKGKCKIQIETTWGRDAPKQQLSSWEDQAKASKACLEILQNMSMFFV
jgi:hypothetical protein